MISVARSTAAAGQKIRMSDNVVCNVVFEDGIGFAREIRVLPFCVDAALVAKGIPHFTGNIHHFNAQSRKGVIENEDGQTINFSGESVCNDENESHAKIFRGYTGLVSFAVKFVQRHQNAFTAIDVHCLE